MINPKKMKNFIQVKMSFSRQYFNQGKKVMSKKS